MMNLKRISMYGLMDAKECDLRDFPLDEWQQAKRIAHHAGETGKLSSVPDRSVCQRQMPVSL
tara:strand:- start:1989 stop:2174 length:186 start_codon:yes stop_codon:yes gene_type:complete